MGLLLGITKGGGGVEEDGRVSPVMARVSPAAARSFPVAKV